ncbi:MAG TPA: hypothetical protein PLR31_02870 [Anaerohalosphaeraceae bacterium]|nr:hypothetical protein [Anaerohalosphaeraceae bacterium]
MASSNLLRFTVGAAVGLLAAMLLFHTPISPYTAQASADLASGSAILAVPIQISRENQGIALIDTRNRTLWIYELFDRQTGFKQIRLMAARSWEYDRLLTEWNSAEPTPQQIRTVLENIHQKQMIESIQPAEPAGEKANQSKPEPPQ